MTKQKMIGLIIVFLLALSSIGCTQTALEKAERALAAGEFDTAVAEYTNALLEQLTPQEQFTALTGRAQSYEGLDKENDALSDYAEALTVMTAEGEFAGDHAPILEARKKIHHELGNLRAAADEITQLLKLNPNSVELLFEQSRLYQALEDWSNVVENTTVILAIEPSNVEAFSMRGDAYLELREFELAIVDLKATVRDDLITARNNVEDKRNLSEAYYQLATVLIKLGEYDDAVANCTHALSYATHTLMQAEIYTLRGFAHSQKGSEAEKVFTNLDRALSLNPNLASAYAYRASLHAQQGSYESAIADAEKAIRIGGIDDETRSFVYHARALVYLYSYQYQLAVQDATKAIDLKTENELDTARTLSIRATAYAQLGNYGLALSDANRALEVGTHDIAALGSFYETRADVYLSMGDYDKALEDLQAALEIDGATADHYNIIGYIYDLQEQYEMAIEAYSNALAIDSEYGVAYYGRGVIYYWLGDIDQALSDLKMALVYAQSDEEYQWYDETVTMMREQ